ncbi:hypothetical protein BBH99_02755 [Chryseobacterium contaminans]|uniref:Dolichyl-phosphate-mannose-protein mannosyltransferase n=1 Tax=Chryseobacterium contaminans TaxID=1423959 RepID=A0A1M7BHQ1_9FLAO|nr:hypothetical protein [Chryseobacterium contaminans]OCA76646.1 hypothetical protein BBH99_02755 [Chryseobacterium contaminans]SHL54477.1 hypothetical protein SAMN05444407_104390 [Chryseobacterium contaminans]
MERLLTTKLNKPISVILFILYTAINLSFLIKYGVRQSVIPIYVLVAVFIIVHFLIFKYSSKVFSKLAEKPFMLKVFIVVIALVYIGLAHILKDPYKLNIDRWQTMEYSLRHWLHGKYIYDTKNFVGNYPSYLPGQLLVAVIFFFLGNVGYLQVAAFLLFCYAIIKEFKNGEVKWTGIFLFAISLSYIYEVVCKSDLISSFIIVSVFILYWHRKFERDYFKNPFLLGLLLGFICLTRSVVIIPLILFLMKPFLASKMSDKVKVGTGFIITFSILLATVLLPAKDLDYILKYNPLQLQGQANKYVTLFFLLATVILAFYVKRVEQVFYFSSVIIFAMMGAYIVETIMRGWTFDYMNVSYLATALPFCIIGFCYTKQKSIQ